MILDKVIVIGKAHRVEHLEAVELRFRMQLQRRTRQKQHTLGTRNYSVRKHVLVARETVLAHQMVSFVNDGHVPVRLEQVFNQRRLRHQEINGHDDIVTLQERVRFRLVLRNTHEESANVAFIHKRKELVEAALHLDHPLVLQRLRDNHERTLDTATRLEGMPNHARFNRLSKPNFVRKHKPRQCRTGACTVAKVILVRDHAHTRANHAADRRREPLVIHFHRVFMTQKITRRTNLVISQSLKEHRRTSRRNFRTQLGLLHFLAVAGRINHNTRIFTDRINDKRNTFFTLDGFAHLQHKTFNRSAIGPVDTGLTNSGKQNFNSTALNFGNNTKPQGRFGLANVALTNFKHHHNP